MYLNSAYPKPPRLFTGKEVEHNYTYMFDTLFICDDVPIQQIQSAILDGRNSVHALYFGAGHLSRVNIETLGEFVRCGYTITVETPDYKLLEKAGLGGKVHLVIPLTNTGVYIDEGWRAIKRLHDEYEDFSYVCRWDPLYTYVKMDNAEGFVFLVSVQHFRHRLTLPSDFNDDKEIPL